MGDPSYTTKWRCKDCGNLYGHNPSECDICGHTLFRPVPADGASETFSGGEEKTELGDDVSKLVDRIDNSVDDDEPVNPTDSTPRNTNDETDEQSLLSRLLPW
jgi:predicted  nucleic acid-binding Zn-ribbon protein